MDKSTEEKIKVVAERLFMERGFSGTRTRDIADEAEINLALLNYYYRSKKNLFNIIIIEKLNKFIEIMLNIIGDDSLDFPGKLSKMVNKYTDLMIKDPNLPLFLMGEVQQNPDFFTEKLNIRSKALNLTFNLKNKETETQLVLDIISLTFYPFIVRKALEGIYNMTPEQYDQLLNKRREIIPKYLTEIYSKYGK